jgi:TPR repeat protein
MKGILIAAALAAGMAAAPIFAAQAQDAQTLRQSCFQLLSNAGSTTVPQEVWVLCDKAIKRNPKDAKLRMRVGAQHIAENNGRAAVGYFEAAAELGDPDAMMFAAGMYMKGAKGAPQDARKGLQWLVRLSETGNSNAMVLAGSIYLYGKGIEQDFKEGERWLRRSAELGNADGQSMLGVMYLQGLGVQEDLQLAYEWFRKAADSGDADAQDAVGQMHEHGMGVEQNTEEALKWYRLAADQGHEKAAAKLQRIENAD